MSKINIYNLEGKVVGQQELNAAVFGVEVDPLVVRQAVLAQQANARRPWAHTKTRSEVRGGGKKPWAQKGTGRARQGSIRSPQWKGGGVAFGPRNTRNYAQALSKKAKRMALRMVLTDKCVDSRIVLVESLDLPAIKTKVMAQALSKLPLKGKTTAVVFDASAKNIEASVRNINKVKPLRADSLNVVDLMKAQTIVMSVNAAMQVADMYGPKKK